jgi:hypothetical protein
MKFEETKSKIPLFLVSMATAAEFDQPIPFVCSK